MSNSPKSRINVVTKDFDVVDLKILDGSLQEVAQGRGHLSMPLPPGFYKIEASAGFQSWSQLVALEEGQTETVHVPPLVLQSPAPLYESKFGHEYHELAAETESHKEHAVRGAGSAIFIMVRYFSPDPQNPGWPPEHPMSGLSLHDADGGLLVDLLAESAYHAPDTFEPDPWAACNVAVDPGYYRLRQELYPGKTIEMPLVAAPNWQIQLFAMLAPVVSAPSRQLRADLPTSSIFYTHYIPGDPQNSQGYRLADRHTQEMLRLTEIARQSLTSRRQPESREISHMFTEKFENPMMGILGGHLVLRQEKPNFNTLSIVVGNLRGMLGSDHPDVKALELALARGRQDRYAKAFDTPPMLRESWQQVLLGSVTQPWIVSPDSLAGTVAGRLWGDGIWLFWNAPESGMPLDSEADDDEELLRDWGSPRQMSESAYLVQQMVTPPGLGGEIAFGLETPGPPEMDEATAQQLVYALGVPRGNVEAMVGKLSEQGLLYESTRKQMRGGRQRTMEMEKIVNDMREMAASSQAEAAKALPGQVEENTAGSRISALALLQVRPDPAYLPFVISAIRAPRSDFEQFHALYAAYKLLPRLDGAQKRQLEEAVRGARGIFPGSDRSALSKEILKRL